MNVSGGIITNLATGAHFGPRQGTADYVRRQRSPNLQGWAPEETSAALMTG